MKPVFRSFKNQSGATPTQKNRLPNLCPSAANRTSLKPRMTSSSDQSIELVSFSLSHSLAHHFFAKTNGPTPVAQSPN